MLLNSYKMESLGVEGVVWPIGLGSTGIGSCFGHRSIADTDPTGFLSDDSDLNMLIDDILESSDDIDDSIDLDYLARVRSLLRRMCATFADILINERMNAKLIRASVEQLEEQNMRVSGHM
jgi:hypothetical protein